jgi:hypothetical protein
VRLVVVGGGPLCTYALERLAALLADGHRVEHVAIAVVERTGRFGAGAVHADTQTSTSLMNRVTAQIALGADETIAAAAPLPPSARPATFQEWAEREGLGLGPRDVPQRRVHGQALRAAFDGYVARLRATDGVTVDLVTGEAVDVASTAGDEGDSPFAVRLDDGRPLPADRVLFVTGHSSNRPAAGSVTEALLFACAEPDAPARRFVRPAYPLERQLDEHVVPPGCRVGLLGLGLTAIDVVLHLTEGRGGRFEQAPGRGGDPVPLTYVPSGREPAALVGACPSGLPVSCRPDNEKAAARTALEHVPEFLSHAAIQTLRETVGRPAVLPDGTARRQLDFDRDVLALVVLEMAWVYYRTALGPAAEAAMLAAAKPRVRRFVRGERSDGRLDDATIDWLLAPLDACAAPLLGRAAVPFDWRRAFAPLPPAAACDGDSWRAAALEFLAGDLTRAARGNLRDPLKAACDGVWRDLRGVLCAAVDRGGLTAASQRRFATVHLRHYNRLSNGAAIEPMRKLLALAQGGLLDLCIGPAPELEPVAGAPLFRIRGGMTRAAREVDVLVEARTDPFHAARDERPLHPALLRRGLVRLWRNPGDATTDDFVPGALDLDEHFHPRGADGRVEPRLTFLGAPAEGLVCFGQTVARPLARNPVLEAVARWAREVTESIAARPPAATGAR